jgi:hypothetical protein
LAFLRAVECRRVFNTLLPAFDGGCFYRDEIPQPPEKTPDCVWKGLSAWLVPTMGYLGYTCGFGGDGGTGMAFPSESDFESFIPSIVVCAVGAGLTLLFHILRERER